MKYRGELRLTGSSDARSILSPPENSKILVHARVCGGPEWQGGMLRIPRKGPRIRRCVRRGLPTIRVWGRTPYTLAATLDTGPVASSYPDGSHTRSPSTCFQSARASSWFVVLIVHFMVRHPSEGTPVASSSRESQLEYEPRRATLGV